MMYLYLYFGTGVILLLLFYIESKFNKNAQENRKLYELMKPANKTIGQKLINDILLPMITLLVVMAFWPVVIVWLSREKYASYKYKPTEEKKEVPFKVKKEDLLKEFTVDEIEIFEMVNDPLKAVPDIPFGHLNLIWTDFKEKIEQSAQIWSFKGQWESKWGLKKEYDGYVTIIDDEPKEFIVTVSKNIEQD